MSQPPVTPVIVDPRQQVQLPAVFLLVVGIIGILTQLASLVVNLLGAGVGAMAGGGQAEQIGQLMSGAVGVVFAVIGILVGGFIIYAALQMKQLLGYTMAMAATIVAMIPCISPCCCLGLPVGIWSLIVLLKPEVKAAFR